MFGCSVLVLVLRNRKLYLILCFVRLELMGLLDIKAVWDQSQFAYGNCGVALICIASWIRLLLSQSQLL
jgi:hypothetical protein